MAQNQPKKSVDKILQDERTSLKRNPIQGATFNWELKNLKHFQVVITGPTGSFYEGGEFEIDIKIRPNYPDQAPLVIMTTPIIHPNIDADDGAVCVACLRKFHNSEVGIRDIVNEVIDALANPKTSDPLNTQAALLLDQNIELFKQKVKAQISENNLNAD